MMLAAWAVIFLPVQGAFDSAGGAFVTTHWSLVLTAQGRSPAADAALESRSAVG